MEVSDSQPSSSSARHRSDEHRNRWLQDAWLPLAVWSVVMLTVVGALWYARSAEHARVESTFQLRTEATADRLASAIELKQELLGERAVAVLAGEEVSVEALRSVVVALGFELGGVFDGEGRYITATRFDPARVGVDLTDELEHVGITAAQGRPAVSQVLVPSSRGVAVVAVSAPYETPYGSRIIAAGMTVRGGVLDDVLYGELRRGPVQTDVVDRDGVLITSAGGGTPSDAVPYEEWNPAAADALTESPVGRYVTSDGVERFLSSAPIEGTDWRVVVTGEVEEVFSGLAEQRRLAIAFGLGLAVIGLVLAAGSTITRRRRREAEQRVRDVNTELERLVEVRTTELREALQRSQAAERAEVEYSALVEDMNQKLEAALHVRDDILATAGHELRTPLTPMLGLLELIDSRWDDLDRATLHAYCGVIWRNAERLAGLVEDLLLATSLQSGAVSANPTAVRVRPVIGGAVQRRPQTTDAVIAGADVVAWCQPDHLEQILEVLLGNAARHGGPPYRVDICVEEPDVVIRISDSGPGITAGTRAMMFKPFAQGSTGDRRSVDRLGLGLPIARALAEANGGRLSYEPAPTGGAVFILRLRAMAVGAATPDMASPGADVERAASS